MFEFLFLDLDDTILDFQKAEHIALSKTLAEFGLEPTEGVLKRYNLINKAHWEALERKEMTRDQVLLGRFQMLFREFSVDADPEKVARSYEHNLGIGHWFLPGASEALPIKCGIKWTNDLVVGKKKLGGILTELSLNPDSSVA